MAKPKNKLRKKGISINAKGIRILKLSSKVKELVIHEIPLRKKPKPNKDPKINKFFLYGFFLYVLLDLLFMWTVR